MNHVNRRISHLLFQCDATSLLSHPLEHSPGETIAVWNRVSSTQQGKAGNAVAQEKNLSAFIESKGGIPYLLPRIEWSGHGESYLEICRQAGNEMRANGIRKAFAATTDRYARSRYYRTGEIFWRAQCSFIELADVKEAFGEDIELFTYLHPNVTPEECKGLMTKWGMQEKNKGGRPQELTRPEFNAIWKPIAVGMFLKKRMRVNQIAREITRLSRIPISHTAVGKWLAPFRGDV